LNAERAIHLVPYGDDPLPRLADLLLERHAAALPDLAAQAVIFPGVAAVARFRRVLLARAAARGYTALLPPFIGTLNAWTDPRADPALRRLTATAREWRFFEALSDFPTLRERFGTWPLIDSLLALFDELTLNQVEIGLDFDALKRELAAGYGARAATLAPFEDEAALIHTLWRAWQTQMIEDGAADTALATVAGLTRSLAVLPASTHVYVAGFARFTRAARAWLEALRARGQLTLLFHGQTGETGYHPESPITETTQQFSAVPRAPDESNAYGRFLDNVYALNRGDLLTRATEQRRVFPQSPARGRLAVLEAPDAEHEARAIDIQVRRWRHAGLRHIGIVTHDRRLARRVRALLERANIRMRDAGGWVLSTTSAENP